MSQYVDLTLDKPRRFRFTPIDARNVCRQLNAIPGMTQGLGGPVTPAALLSILGGRDFDAYAMVLGQGLQHEDRDMNTDRALRALTDYLGGGGSLGPIANAIIEAGMASGVWERAASSQDGNGATSGNPDGPRS